MNPRRNAEATRDLIFAACNRILQREGLASLTLDAVAEEAGLSKGGLLYHFPSKVEMIEALFQYHIDRFNQRLEALVIEEGQETGGWLRAYAQASIEQITDPDKASMFASLFAAGERYPTVLAIMKRSYDEWQQQVERCGVAPDVAMLVRLTVDGLWFTEMYQYAPPSIEQRKAVMALILQLTSKVTT
ncbi:MAG: TetR/AcrR family transcriptional regulator [Caldilineaceae bacterium]